jgi:hypothetical protein
MTKVLVALLVLLAGVPELVAGREAQSKSPTETKDTQSKNAQGKDPARKDAPAQAQDSAKDTAEKPEIHEFVIANFKTESGVTLPQARVV